jgi:hypothetical protein
MILSSPLKILRLGLCLFILPLSLSFISYIYAPEHVLLLFFA